MMISPQTYVMMLEDKSYRELIEERDRLIDEIRELEEMVLNRDPLDEAWLMCPNPETRYGVGLEYLAELCHYMSERKIDDQWADD